MVKRAALEMRYARKGIGGSNPPASANNIFYRVIEGHQKTRSNKIRVFC